MQVSGSFADGTHQSLLKTYGSLETVDLWVGGLGEIKVSGGLVGPTLACIFAKTFEALRDGDRFYYENPDSLFTMQQRKEIEKTSLSRIICDNSDGIKSIQRNAFLAGQERKKCSSKSISRVNLAAWSQATKTTKKCYLRTSVRGKTKITTISKPGKKITVRSRSRRIACIPFSCPSPFQDTVKVTLRAISNTRRRKRSCKIWPFGFRSSQRRFTFKAKLKNLNSKGIYESYNSCKYGKKLNAVIACCRRYEIADMESDKDNDELFDSLLKLLE